MNDDKVWEDTRRFETNIDEPNPNRFKTGRDIASEDLGSVFMTRIVPGSLLFPWHNSDLWDFAIQRPDGKKPTFEWKSDWRSAETSNVFFEDWNNKKNEPSGLSKTKAEWWCHYLPGEKSVLVFKVKKMREYLDVAMNKGAIDHLYLEKAGDNGNARGFLVNTELIKALDFVTVLPNFGF